MLCINGWGRGGRCYGSGMDALRERMGSGWTLLRFRHGCSALTDGVGVDVITVPAWMLCVNGWGRGGHYYGSGMDALRERMGSGGRYYGSDMDALRERMGSGWTLLRFRHGCSA